MTRYDSPGPAGAQGARRHGANGPDRVPVEVRDRLLWLDAQQMLGRHSGAGPDGTCGWCGAQWPCPPRRLAERAEAAARQPWRESRTARYESNGVRARAGWRAGPGASARPAGRNGGLFD